MIVDYGRAVEKNGAVLAKVSRYGASLNFTALRPVDVLVLLSARRWRARLNAIVIKVGWYVWSGMRTSTPSSLGGPDTVQRRRSLDRPGLRSKNKEMDSIGKATSAMPAS